MTTTRQLFHISEIPSFFHELYILRGYRHPRSSIRSCLRSCFYLHNETVNFWTHFIPAIFYLYVLITDCYQFNLLFDPYGYPMLGYLISMTLFPTASAVAHLFNTISEKARHMCFFLDYFALSVYGIGTAIAYHAYSFPVALISSKWMDLYLLIAVINALLSFILACRTRFIDHGIRKKIFRICSFAVPYLFDVIPISYRAMHGDAIDFSIGGMHYHSRQFVFAFVSAFLYSSHLPERLSPGRFDFIGQSHQIFHVASVIGTHDLLVGLRMDMMERRELLKTHEPNFTIFFMVAVVALNLVVLYYFWMQLDGVILKSTSSQDLTKLNNLCSAAKSTNEKLGHGLIDSRPTNGVARQSKLRPHLD